MVFNLSWAIVVKQSNISSILVPLSNSDYWRAYPLSSAILPEHNLPRFQQITSLTFYYAKEVESIGRNSSSCNLTCNLICICSYLHLLSLDSSKIPAPLCVISFPTCGLHLIPFLSLRGTYTTNFPFLFILNLYFSACCFLLVFNCFTASAFRNLVNNSFFTPKSWICTEVTYSVR